MPSQRASVQTRIASAGKALLPTALHGPGQRAWRACLRVGKWRSNVGLKLSLLLHRIRGGTYFDWYSRTLDSWAQEQRDPDTMRRRFENNRDNGVQDLEVLRHFGLEPQHTLLDFGAGHLRSGRWIMGYLEPGHYVAADASAERLAIGEEWFAETIAAREPEIIVNPDNSFDWVAGRGFDFIWSNAVFGHMPGADVEQVVRDARKALRPGGILMFTHNSPAKTPSDPNWLVIEEDARNYAHSFRWFAQLADKYGYMAEDVSDVIVPYDAFHANLRMCKLTLNGSAA